MCSLSQLGGSSSHIKCVDPGELIQQQQYEMKIRRMQCLIHCMCYYSGKRMNQDIWKRKQQSNKRARFN